MPVIWQRKQARRWDNAALAVPCATCGVTIGQPCTQHYGSGDAREPHRPRAELAEEFGFVAVPAPAAPTVPETLVLTRA